MTSGPPVPHRQHRFKMDQQWIHVLATLLLYHRLTQGAVRVHTVKEGQPFDITCKPSEMGSMTIWFRVRDTSGVEFIASFSNHGMIKAEGVSYTSTFSGSKMPDNIMTLTSFSKGRDSGLYGCASLKNNQLLFGDVTRLAGVEAATKAAVAPTVKVHPSMTSLPCVCERVARKGDALPCSPIILIPLAGSCGLLLLIVLIVIVYCNQVRTRRCPHHYKRRPRKVAPGKQQQHT
ncbi:T-cell surface glycoprotein CD8 alpha chain [Dunckerocampus dactyliophorus]|uniref:T-cell surface glycoprotein CD8 alpha chain n=1 Tax=Dunckerocampus dactyliophorus TaxID=161453 RepID=UPI00240555D7|nr:T-cell surface glycoprotein CD8 alpha chain [Dunckerocampus dactyliophorus]